MEEKKFNLSIKNIRAINSADINIDGITVLTGENGCGKSTVSKILYSIIKTSRDYDLIVDEDFKKLISDILNVVRAYISDILQEVLYKDKIFMNEHEKFMDYDRMLHRIRSEIREKKSIDTIKDLNKFLESIRDIKYSDKQISNRVSSRFISLYNKMFENEITEKTMYYFPDKLFIKLNKILEEIKKTSIERSLDICNKKLWELLKEDILLNNVSLKEYDTDIIDTKNHKLAEQFSVKEIAYINSPVFFEVCSSCDKQDKDLFDLLKNKKGDFIKNEEIEKIFYKEVLKGKIELESNVFFQNFKYIREDGRRFDIEQSATGIKSFAYLQLLYTNGVLNDKTLLIIDEPEAHLHPQWIVEYARLLVLIHKHLGVTFLLASHNPDMISALKYISEKEKISDKVCFYLAEKSENKDDYSYDYKNLGLNIEPIFESFNIAIDRIADYAEEV